VTSGFYRREAARAPPHSGIEGVIGKYNNNWNLVGGSVYGSEIKASWHGAGTSWTQIKPDAERT
jgi:hypothetical protein